MIAGSPASILDYGAKLDGVTDDTAAWQMALADRRLIHFPEGRSRITNKLSFPTVDSHGVAIVGAGRHKSLFIIDTGFNMAATSIIQLGDVFQGVKNVGFLLFQPSATLRSSVRQYPWVIDLNGHARAEIESIRIEGGWQGIRGSGNVGGAVIDDVQIGCLLRGMLIDGALDSVRINRYHYWPFGIAGTAGLFEIYTDGDNVALDFGRCDDLNISSILCFQALMRFADYGSGSSFGVASNITMDGGYAQVDFLAGEMVINGLYSSSALANDYMIFCTGGELKIAGLAMECGVPMTTYAMVRVAGADTRFMASDIMVISGGGLPVFEVTAGSMQISNGYIFAVGTRTRGIISVAGGRAVVTGMRANDKGNSVGSFVSVTTDDHHVIIGNAFTGWSYDLPAAPSTGLYAPNVGIGNQAALQTNVYASPIKTKRLTATLNASGSATIGHGVSNGHIRVSSVSGFWVGPSAERVMISDISVDGTNIVLTAGSGAASRAAEVWYRYT
jgi:Pectate lyase superfamily protein